MVHAACPGIFVLQLLGGQAGLCLLGGIGCRGGGSEEDWAKLEGDVVGVVGAFLIAELHGEIDGHLVASLPSAVDGHIAGLPLGDGDTDGLAIDAHAILLSGPCGVAHGKGVFATLGDGEGGGGSVGRGDGRCGGVDAGEEGLLADAEGGVAELTGCEEVDVECIVAVVGVDEVSVFGVVLHAGAHTAPHALVDL